MSIKTILSDVVFAQFRWRQRAPAQIGLEIERSNTLSDHVCHACASKVRNASELYDFIYLSLQKGKQATFEACLLDSSRWMSLLAMIIFCHQIKVL